MIPSGILRHYKAYQNTPITLYSLWVSMSNRLTRIFQSAASRAAAAAAAGTSSCFFPLNETADCRENGSQDQQKDNDIYHIHGIPLF